MMAFIVPTSHTSSALIKSVDMLPATDKHESNTLQT